MNGAVWFACQGWCFNWKFDAQKKNYKNLLYEMVEMSNRNLCIIGQIATRYYFGEIPEEQK